MSRHQRLLTLLTEALSPVRLDIKDESYKHQGHVGAPAEGESHYRIKIVSENFKDLNRIKRHQLVYSILKEELEMGLHALQLTTLTPDEAVQDSMT